MTYIVGVDLGKLQDFTAICIAQKLTLLKEGTYQISKQPERYKGTSYKEIAKRLRKIMSKLPNDSRLVVDATGVGEAVIELFEDLKPISIWIHGGVNTTHDGNKWKVPKTDLVSVMEVLIQNGKLEAPPGELTDILIEEILNFKIKKDPETGHESYSAWRDRDHDDMVLALSLACWWGEIGQKESTKGKFNYKGTSPENLGPDGKVPVACGPSFAERFAQTFHPGW
jgi:hypothetical protein